MRIRTRRLDMITLEPIKKTSKMLTGAYFRGSTLIQIYLCHPSPALVCHACIRTSAERLIEPALMECYTTLKVTPDSSVSEVKESYINLAKKYHPDADPKTENSETFAKINYAYNTIMKKLQQQQRLPPIIDDDDTKEKKLNSPQHRQYLSYEGIGRGTMSQREKQYNQYRVMRAAERIHEYQTEKITCSQEDSMVLKDKKSTRKFKISNAIERVVEDLIQDAMGKGEFHNLPGSGKPLSFTSYNPMLDVTTHNLNKVLINNGYTPEWILMRKEIKEHLCKLHSNLAKCLIQSKGSDHALNQFQVGIKDINEKIDKYNMVVPILNKQMVHYSYQNELKKVQRNPKEFIRNMSTSDILSNKSHMKDALHSDPINWSQVWKDIKDIFR